MAKKPGTALVALSERMKARIAANAKAEESSVGSMGGSYFSFKGGIMSYKGTEVTDNEVDVIVVGYILENQFFADRYTPDTPQSPVCYSKLLPVEGDVNDMIPMEESEAIQHSDCKTCPMNQFGSADTGKGKACKNIRHLAVIPADALESSDDIEAAEIAFMKLPPTSLKAWSGYIKALTTAGLSELCVITKITLEKDADTQIKLSFSRVDDIGEECYEALFKRNEEAEEHLLKPYPTNEELQEQFAARNPKPQRGKAKPLARGLAKPAAKPAVTRRKF